MERTGSTPPPEVPPAPQAEATPEADPLGAMGERSVSPIPAPSHAYLTVAQASSITQTSIFTLDGGLSKSSTDCSDDEWWQVTRATFAQAGALPSFPLLVKELIDMLKTGSLISVVYFALKNTADGYGNWAETAKRLLQAKCLGGFSVKDLHLKNDRMILKGCNQGNESLSLQWNAWENDVNQLRCEIRAQYASLGML